jgi:hypothetical protein
VFQRPANGLKLFGGTVGEIGDRPVLDLPILTIGGAQEDAGVHFAVALSLAFIKIHSGYYYIDYNYYCQG